MQIQNLSNRVLNVERNLILTLQNANRNHNQLIAQMQGMENRIHNRLEGMENRMEGMENRMQGIENQMHDFQLEMRLEFQENNVLLQRSLEQTELIANRGAGNISVIEKKSNIS